MVRIVEGLLRSERCDSRTLPRTRNPASRAGLSFEKEIGKEIKKHEDKFHQLEHNPWFQFHDRWGRGQAVPDYLLWIDSETLIVIEVKLKFIIEAVDKLRHLYCPVIKAATGIDPRPLIVCRHLIPGVLPIVSRVRDALDLQSSIPTLQWVGSGRLPW